MARKLQHYADDNERASKAANKVANTQQTSERRKKKIADKRILPVRSAIKKKKKNVTGILYSKYTSMTRSAMRCCTCRHRTLPARAGPAPEDLCMRSLRMPPPRPCPDRTDGGAPLLPSRARLCPSASSQGPLEASPTLLGQLASRCRAARATHPAALEALRQYSYGI